MDDLNVIDLLTYIDPAKLDYQDWLSVGMALKDAGYTASDWDEWSRNDDRYSSGTCFKKWDSFNGSGNPVTVGSIVQFAKDQGWRPEGKSVGYELDWDSVIGAKDDYVVIDTAWVEGKEVTEPDDWNPVKQLVRYLEVLFEASENVGYVTESWEKDGKYLPTKGCWDRTAGELIQQLNKCGGDIGSVVGDCKPEAGAWIRFNPLDGNGCKNENVTDYRYALVESDETTIDQQNAIIRELELPVACLVHSGNKSLHAIVRVEATSYEQYRTRVDYLYTILKKNGMSVDTQNKNPSRLSRMPGIMREGHKQFLVDTNIGKESFTEWQEWIESVNDDLPEPVSLASVWDNMPELSPPLIEGVLRQGHKMLLAGPSKAGKSFALIELCCSIAEGRPWFQWNCTKGRVLYVNLELDEPSCMHRFKDVYEALGWEPLNISNIEMWNLRGKSVPMDKLAPKLIRRAHKKNYIAIVIDPIYKVITGDENSADQMAQFCNQFDRVCSELGAAVIYCHHHSKGSQGSKRSMDRASGSGVFARDPDALLDLIELEVTDALKTQEQNKAVANVCAEALDKHVPSWRDDAGEDDIYSQNAMLDLCKMRLLKDAHNALLDATDEVRKTTSQRTAWRIEGTLREYPKFEPVNLWFDYPIHNVDDIGSLEDVEAEGESTTWQKAAENRKKNASDKRRDLNAEISNAIVDYKNANFGDDPTVKDLANFTNTKLRTMQDQIKKHPTLAVDKSTNKIVEMEMFKDDGV